MRVLLRTWVFDASFVLALVVGGAWAADQVSSKDGRIAFEDGSGHMIALTQTGLDSDPWLSPDGHTVVFLRHSAEDTFQTSVYEIDVRTKALKLLYKGPARYQGRESSYFGGPQLNRSQDTLFLLSDMGPTQGSLIAIGLAHHQARLITDNAVGYSIVGCSTDRGDLLVLKREHDMLGHPFYLYWLYSPLGKQLSLAGTDDLNVDMLQDGHCEEPVPLPSTPPVDPIARGATRVDGSVMERQLVRRVEPTYPGEAKSERVQGDIRLVVRIGADGTVQDVNLLSGPPQLVGAAIAAVKQWRYRPMMSSGHPVPVVTIVNVEFRLPAAGSR